MIQSAIAVAGLSLQAVKGTPEADAAYRYGLLSGSVVSVEIEQTEEDRTSGKRIVPAMNRDAIMSGTEQTVRAHPGLIGLLLYAALGAIDTTGTDPYTHVLTHAEDIPYLTGFGQLGDEILRVQDGKVDELTISWTAAGAIEVGVTVAGTRVTFPVDFGTVGTNEELAGYFKASGGAFLVDVDGASPAAAIVTAGEITIANNLESIIAGGSIFPSEVFPGRQDIGVNLTIVPDDFTTWRSILTGSPTGSLGAECPVYGSFDLTFSGCVDPAHSLQFAAPRVAFAVDFPDVNPSGGKVELELEGMVVQPSDGVTESFEATVVNAVASYTS